MCGLVRLKDFAASFGCCVSQQLLCFGSLYAKSPKNMVLCTVPHHGWIWMAPLLLHWSTIPQSHCSSMLSTCRSLSKLSDFWLKQSKKDIGYRLDGDLQGFLQTCCSCSTGHCAPSGSARLKYLRHADVEKRPMQINSAVQCHFFKPEETQGASLRTRAAGSHFWILSRDTRTTDGK